MKIERKKYIVAVLRLLILSISPGFYIYVYLQYHKTVIRQKFIHIDYSNNHHFIDKEIVDQLLFPKGDMPKDIAEIDPAKLEKYLESYPHIKNAEVYLGVDGTLYADIYQINPIAKIFNQKNEMFYLNDDGSFAPKSEKYTARVLVVNGNVIIDSQTPFNILKQASHDSSKQYTQWKEIYDLAHFIYSKPFWNKQIQQIHVNKDFEYELMGSIGNHTIVLGKPYPLSGKFTKLMIFYQKALPVVGWSKYQEINLKYNNQIICK